MAYQSSWVIYFQSQPLEIIIGTIYPITGDIDSS